MCDNQSIESSIHKLNLRNNQLTVLSKGISKGLTDIQLKEIEEKHQEYCALVIMLRFMEFSNNSFIVLSIKYIMHIYNKSITDRIIVWSNLNDAAIVRGYDTAYRGSLRVGSIKQEIDNNRYIIMLYKDILAPYKTYALICAGYTLQYLICYHLVDGIITKLELPVLDLTLRLGLATYEYDKTITGFTRAYD